jgi:hypothetical protein
MSSTSRPLFSLAAAVAGAVPVVFALIRAISTGGNDLRYLWLAAAALVGSIVAVSLGEKASISVGRAMGAVAAGTAGAAAAAMALGTTAGLGLAIVALGFGLCSGTSAVLSRLANVQRPRE